MKYTLFSLYACVGLFIVIFFSSCTQKSPPQLVLEKSSFKHLNHWENDDHHHALIAFQKSCKNILKRNSTSVFGNRPHFGTTFSWQKICLAANRLNTMDKRAAQVFFETWFEPYAVKENINQKGLFTGYYLPLLKVNFSKNERYRYPIYGMPPDLVRINLRDFSADLPNRTLTGQIKNKTIIPYPDRAQINDGKILNQAPVLFWGDNELDIFFAQIQGSALVQLPDGRQVLLGYAGQNGRAYQAIGKVLLDKQFVDKETISMQSIRAWLQQHPREAKAILNSNTSYVFFHILQSVDPIGSLNIPLTAKRSLAVDSQYIPLGAPLWLETTYTDEPEKSLKDYQHLLIAQDTGGSIKGIVRGDIYWGSGMKASAIAGQMKNSGSYWLLLPRNIYRKEM